MWTEAFLGIAIFEYADEDSIAEEEIRELRGQFGILNVYFAHREDAAAHREGPYFVHMGKVYPAYRLYPDTAEAFMVGTVPADKLFRYVLLRPLRIGRHRSDILEGTKRSMRQPTAKSILQHWPSPSHLASTSAEPKINHMQASASP